MRGRRGRTDPLFLPDGRGRGVPHIVREQPVLPPFSSSTIPFDPLAQNAFIPAQNTPLPYGTPPYPNYVPVFQPELHHDAIRESIERIDRVVSKCRRDILAVGEAVSLYKVSQASLSILQVDSWESLGFHMQQIPSIYSLMDAECKINAFIHCFVGVRGIATLHDLEVSICKNEGLEKFDQLDLGPLIRHPLIMHYFSLGSDVDDVVKISSVEIILCLCEFLVTRKKKHVKVNAFLDFVAKKHSVSAKHRLGVRIQDLGRYVTYIQEAKDGEDVLLKKCLLSHKNKSTRRKKKRPLFPSLKKNLDDRFKVMSNRVQSFAFENDNFFGKHMVFISSSSDEDNDSDDYSIEDEMDTKGSGSQCTVLPHTTETSEKLSSCPYPSATEEMTRLGLKAGTDDASPADGRSEHYGNRSDNRKRKKSCITPRSHVTPRVLKNRKVKEDNPVLNVKYDFCLNDYSQRIFITTWKEACRELDVSEVLERMIQFCRPSVNQAERLRTIFTAPPFMGLLNVAVKSIKSGMWDSIYDAFQDGDGYEASETKSETHTEYEIIDVGPAGQSDEVVAKDSSSVRLSDFPDVAPVNIISKMATYFEPDNLLSDKQLITNKGFMLLKKLRHCEDWLGEQFAVSNFNDLGCGDFFSFIEKHASMLPDALLGCLKLNLDKFPLEVLMHEHQLIVLLSQALHGLFCDVNTVCKEDVTSLLMRQFPCVSFKAIEYGSLESFINELGVQNNLAISSCVIFSQTLFGTSGASSSKEHSTHNKCNTNNVSEPGNLEVRQKEYAMTLGSVSLEHAIETLLNSPMLSDLTAWSHWDLIFAPHLGPLVELLLKGVCGKKLTCLLTKDGKIIRIDESATVESFFEVLLQGCPFRTAASLLSLFSLFGGKAHVPLSLLKCHVCRAFDVILKGSTKYAGQDPSLSFHTHGISQSRSLEECLSNSHRCESCERAKTVNEGVSAATKFMLECLCYLPSEFRNFAADVLLSGLRSVAKDAPSIMLQNCDDTLPRTMLHDIGISLGVVEWIDDYHLFRSSFVFDSSPCLHGKKSSSTAFLGRTEMRKMDSLDVVFEDEKIQKSVHDQTSLRGPGIFVENSSKCYVKDPSGIDSDADAISVIESIRREEFGIDSCLPDTENCVLKKQHARLGRALHCLSQELYSQDSHFILELVQNADDNLYPENVEPTLTFILLEKAIVVLNNECGFFANNIRALCDVGNSTKKGSTAGYIGNKGIGFKSVFRVTEAPEIHSNGFHVKFDISEGQIGFVLPTIIPPCDVSLFQRMISVGKEEPDFWNTCIVLPFKSKISEESSVNNVVSMFSDLHPSLLLFLHRLQCIRLRNVINDTFLVMRKETLGNGIVKVYAGEENMTWFVVSQKLRTDIIRATVQMTEIAIAFTLLDTDGDGQYAPHLKQQPVFSFLPLRNYGLKFIVQGDFVLPSSREEVDGNSSWNQWLLSEFPSLFVNAEKLFCALPCFEGKRGKAVTAFMSFVPLVGEVHGFFSTLPRTIVSRLCISNCMLVEGEDRWVPPCKVLRNWNEVARSVLPDKLLYDHLGLSFLDKDITLTDSLANALGIEDYGPKILVQVMSTLCRDKKDLMSMGLNWICHWLNAFYTMYLLYESRPSVGYAMEFDLINDLKKLPFIPLSDGTYGSIHGGTIWLHSDAFSTKSVGCVHELEAFPSLYAKLRIVNTELFSITTSNMSLTENAMKMLCIIGVQQLTAHEILKLHIFPGLCSSDHSHVDNNLIIEFLSFAMFHLQSDCCSCIIEKEYIISELRKAVILTNHGYKRPVEESIHFSKEYGNPVDINRLIGSDDLMWYEIDGAYLTHPVTSLVSCGMSKWREFFKELGVNDFVQVVEVERNISDMQPTVFSNMLQEDFVVFPCSCVRDWESKELNKLLSALSIVGDRVKCSYLLESFDLLWDEYFSDKVAAYVRSEDGKTVRTFRSSFIASICDTKWVTSNADLNLYYPKDLFHECGEVVSILGMHAPYAKPKVRDGKFVTDVGLKTSVRVDDALTMFLIWRKTESPFMASIAQMSRFYTYIWNEMGVSKNKIMEVLHSGPFIFVPNAAVSKNDDDAVPGTILTPEEVFWSDANFHGSGASCHLRNGLCSLYPALHDFFVNECKVSETPSFQCAVQFLLELPSSYLPSQAANTVFHVLCKWADQLNDGRISSEDITYLRESLTKVEFAILPTVLDKWVSMHSSFGIICWCNDQKLRKEFRYQENIDFLYFPAQNSDRGDIMHSKIAKLFHELGIPALSQIVTREAVAYGSMNSSFKASLVNWSLPYAQRYIYTTYPDKYSKFQLSGVKLLDNLQVVVVEKLFYKHVIKSCNLTSDKRYECTSILQDNLLYATCHSDPHSLFLELSHLFFDGSPELHLANLLHMLTTMAESGSTDDQIEFFIVNSQKLPKLPDNESPWFLASLLLQSAEKLAHRSQLIKPPNPFKKFEVSPSGPHMDLLNAPVFAHAPKARKVGMGPITLHITECGERLAPQSSLLKPHNLVEKSEASPSGPHLDFMNTPIFLNASQENRIDVITPHTADQNGTAEAGNDYGPDGILPMEIMEVQQIKLTSNPVIVAPSEPTEARRFQFDKTDPSAVRAIETGRVGELVAFNYFACLFGEKNVRWVNKEQETGLPYDIIIGDGEASVEYVEVKATRYARKDWFTITTKEWQFALEKGDNFSVVHINLSQKDNAHVTVFKNPARLCQQGYLQLALMQRQHKDTYKQL